MCRSLEIVTGREEQTMKLPSEEMIRINIKERLIKLWNFNVVVERSIKECLQRRA